MNEKASCYWSAQRRCHQRDMMHYVRLNFATFSVPGYFRPWYRLGYYGAKRFAQDRGKWPKLRRVKQPRPLGWITENCRVISGDMMLNANTIVTFLKWRLKWTMKKRKRLEENEKDKLVGEIGFDDWTWRAEVDPPTLPADHATHLVNPGSAPGLFVTIEPERRRCMLLAPHAWGLGFGARRRTQRGGPATFLSSQAAYLVGQATPSNCSGVGLLSSLDLHP